MGPAQKESPVDRVVSDLRPDLLCARDSEIPRTGPTHRSSNSRKIFRKKSGCLLRPTTGGRTSFFPRVGAGFRGKTSPARKSRRSRTIYWNTDKYRNLADLECAARFAQIP